MHTIPCMRTCRWAYPGCSSHIAEDRQTNRQYRQTDRQTCGNICMQGHIPTIKLYLVLAEVIIISDRRQTDRQTDGPQKPKCLLWHVDHSQLNFFNITFLPGSIWKQLTTAILWVLLHRTYNVRTASPNVSKNQERMRSMHPEYLSYYDAHNRTIFISKRSDHKKGEKDTTT